MIRACFREVEVSYIERTWRASIRHDLCRAFPVDGVSERDRLAGEPEEFAALLLSRPADRAAVTRLLRGGDWRVTREQPASGYPRRVYLAPLWDDLGPCAYCQLPLVPGVGDEVEHARSAGLDGRLRYFCPVSPDALHHAEPRFCVETAAGWQHLIGADVAADRGLDVDRAFCPEHDAAPLAR